MNNTKSWLSILSLLLVADANAKNDVQTLLGLSLQELLEVKIETASLTEETVATAPAAMSVFTRAEIERLPVNYLHELLQFVPGYQVTRELDYSYQYSLSARARKTGASAREILFLLDGVPVNNPRNGNAAGVFLYPVNHIERVEVMRGPGSALYGSNAITGVVNIITIKGANSLGLSFSEHNGKQLNAFYHTKIDEWRLDLSVHAEEDSGQEYLVPDTFSANRIDTEDPISQKNINASIGMSDISFQVQYREVEADDFYNTGRISNEYNFSYLSSTFANFSYQFRLWQDIESKFSANFVHVNTKNGNQSTPPGAFVNVSQPATDAPLFGYGEFKTNRVRFDWQNSKDIDDQAQVLFGLEYRKESIKEGFGYANFDLVALTNQRCYMEAWQINDVLDHIKKKRGTHFDPKLIDILFDNIDELFDAWNKVKNTEESLYKGPV